MEPLGRRVQAVAVDVIGRGSGGGGQDMNARRSGLAGGAAAAAADDDNDDNDAAAAALSPSRSHRVAAAEVAVESDNSDGGYQCAAYEIGETGDVDC